MECVFCNIAEKKAEAEILFEDEHIISFLDIQPVNYGHTLVVTKKHYDNFLTVPQDEMNSVIKAVQFIAGVVKRGMNADGFNIISNNGDSAGQTVYHFHFHIIPRFNSDFNIKPKVKIYGAGEIKNYAGKIRNLLSQYRNVYNG